MGRVITAFVSVPTFLVLASIIIGIFVGSTDSIFTDALTIFGDDERLSNVVLSGLVYGLTLGLLLVVLKSYLFGRAEKITNILGLVKTPVFKQIGFTLLAFGGYFIASLLLVVIAQEIIPSFDVDQAQETGQSQPGNLNQYIVAFIGLVILPPIFEELIFRGYMFKGLRKQLSFWPTAILTSVAFGVVHGQWNVGIDTFVLSIFLCMLREYTGSIWPCILLHALKNGLAFSLLFVFDVA